MEQTVKNMKLVIDRVESEIIRGKAHEAKTLMNTYMTLLRQVQYEDEILEYKEVLDKQVEKLLSLYERVNQQIANAITHRREYKEADVLSVVAERLYESSKKVRRITYDSREEQILPQNSRERLLPQNAHYYTMKENKPTNIGIFSKDDAKAKEKFFELEKKFKFEIVELKISVGGKVNTFKTEDMTVTIYNYTEDIRGRRMDEIYVDIDLSIDDLNIIKAYKKEKNIQVNYY